MLFLLLLIALLLSLLPLLFPCAVTFVVSCKCCLLPLQLLLRFCVTVDVTAVDAVDVLVLPFGVTVVLRFYVTVVATLCCSCC